MRELVRTRERVRQDVQGPRNELRQEADGEGLRPTQDLLSQGVEKQRPGASFLVEIGYCCAVVAEDGYVLPDKRRLKMEETLPDGQELASVDGESCLIRIPKAVSGQRSEVSTQTTSEASDQKSRSGET